MNRPVHILGISAFYHDSAAALVRGGEIVAAAQEERFTRVKHDSGFPAHAIRYCLEQGRLSAEALDYVVFYEKPWIKFERLIETYVQFAPRGLRSFLMAMPLWLKRKLWIGRLLQEELETSAPLLFTEHHQAHAASAFYPSPFRRAAILTSDGVGEWATASWGTGEGARLRLEAELCFPHSLGLLYSAFTYYCGFRVNSGEYKLMGLAPYGEPRFVPQILDELVELTEDGSFRLNMRYFDFATGLRMTSDAFHRLFGGPPRAPDAEITQRDADLARSIQEVTEEIMLRMARHVRRETGERYLCLAGGVALNAVANGRILREGIFEDLWIQPAAGDAGGALGAALQVYYDVIGGERSVDGRRDAQKGSLLGPAYPTGAIQRWLDEEGLSYRRCASSEALVTETAEHLAAGKVVGWFAGRMEFGPRALGARSILADPRSPEMQSLLNRKIKFRESFRPFAPACLREDAALHFELDRDAPYMLVVVPVRGSEVDPSGDADAATGGILERLRTPRGPLPAITHVDRSARVQTVDPERNPRLDALLQAFKQRTGYGVLVNTSFNRRGEPIVCTPQDAYACFMGTGMDVLVLEDLILLKEEQPPDRMEEGQWEPGLD